VVGGPARRGRRDRVPSQQGSRDAHGRAHRPLPTDGPPPRHRTGYPVWSGPPRRHCRPRRSTTPDGDRRPALNRSIEAGAVHRLTDIDLLHWRAGDPCRPKGWWPALGSGIELRCACGGRRDAPAGSGGGVPERMQDAESIAARLATRRRHRKGVGVTLSQPRPDVRTYEPAHRRSRILTPQSEPRGIGRRPLTAPISSSGSLARLECAVSPARISAIRTSRAALVRPWCAAQ
jgi:hypothetical protein